jgi:hypothetical protein
MSNTAGSVNALFLPNIRRKMWEDAPQKGLQQKLAPVLPVAAVEDT